VACGIRRAQVENESKREGLPEEVLRERLSELERNESDFTRLSRQKLAADDFDLLTIIGRGAFGEVRVLFVPNSHLNFGYGPSIGREREQVALLLLWFCLQVRVCREKATGKVFAMKKLKKSEMVKRGQVKIPCKDLP
jgi:serine/threonine kinase 38